MKKEFRFGEANGEALVSRLGESGPPIERAARPDLADLQVAM